MAASLNASLWSAYGHDEGSLVDAVEPGPRKASWLDGEGTVPAESPAHAPESEPVRREPPVPALPSTVVDPQGRAPELASPEGTRVTGAVIDPQGQAHGGVWVHLERLGGGQDGGRIQEHRARSGADGSFHLADPIPHGTWRVRVRGGQRLSPDDLELELGQDAAFLQVVVVNPEDLDTIRGIVLDEGGLAVVGAEVRYYPTHGGGGSGRTERTADDGSFTIERWQGDPEGPVSIHIEHEGYGKLLGSEEHAWGSADVRLVLGRGRDLELQVTDTLTGEPIGGFGARVLPALGSSGPLSASVHRLRQSGDHPAGRLTIRSLREGRHLLVVEPTNAVWSVGTPVPFEVSELGTPPMKVALPRTVRRILRVRSRDGSPVAGTRVELILGLGELPVDLATRALPIEDLWSYPGRNRAVILDQGSTDSNGELGLTGPAGITLVLRVIGPGHQPALVDPVSLEEGAAPLEVTVRSGASLHGRVGPELLVQQLRTEAGIEVGQPAVPPPGLEARAPGVRLRRSAGPGEDGVGSFPTKRIPLEEDGSFSIEGIPPGSWELELVSSQATGSSSHATIATPVLTLVGLRDGETRRVDLALDHLLQAELSGRVLVNGVVHSGGRILIRGDHGLDDEGQGRSASTATDEEGRFHVGVAAGDYRVWVQVRDRASGRWCSLPTDGRVSLLPGESVQRTFHATFGGVRLRLLTAEGEPVPWARLRLVDAEDGAVPLPPTDADGVTSLDHVPTGSLRIVAGDGPHETIDLGATEVTEGGEVAQVELRIPRDRRTVASGTNNRGNE